MFAGKTWISNEFKKVKNPTKIFNVANTYEGLLTEEFNFKFQKNNFDIIKNSLEPFLIFPQEIYYAERDGRSTFVVTWTNPNIFWHKYEGGVLGSGQNYIYWKGHKINTTGWIKMYSDDISNILNCRNEDLKNTIERILM